MVQSTAQEGTYLDGTITVAKASKGYDAYITGRPDLVAHGRSIGEAIGNLVINQGQTLESATMQSVLAWAKHIRLGQRWLSDDYADNPI